MTDNITPTSLNQPIIATVKTHLEVTCDPAFDEAWINGVRYVPAPDRPAVTPAADARGLGSVAEQASPVATDSGRLIIAQALTAEADSNDDSTHLAWITSHELRRAVAILRDDVSTQSTPPAAAPDRPLWDAMISAHDDAVEMGQGCRHGMAAELRVVADWLERRWPQGPDMHPCACAIWLRAEAERAEAP